MLFKKEIQLLKTIKSQTPKLPNDFYDYADIFPLSNMSEAEYLSALRNMEKENIIYFGDSQKTAFRIESNGLYFNEFRRRKLKEYIADKIVDFFAVAVSIVALICSLIF